MVCASLTLVQIRGIRILDGIGRACSSSGEYFSFLFINVHLRVLRSPADATSAEGSIVDTSEDSTPTPFGGATVRQPPFSFPFREVVLARAFFRGGVSDPGLRERFDPEADDSAETDGGACDKDATLRADRLAREWPAVRSPVEWEPFEFPLVLFARTEGLPALGRGSLW